MKNLYKVKLERTTYAGQKSIETIELFAASKQDINKYRLGGFQHDSIKIISARKLRARQTIELDVDLVRNEISGSVSLDDHLKSTLEHAEKIENAALAIAEQNEIDLEDALLEMGYIERSADNSYNYSSDFDNDMNFKIYTLSDKSDYLYSKDAIVLVKEHRGLDVRDGYRFKGIYKGSDFDGLCNFLDMHIRVTVTNVNDENEQHDFDGDWSFGCMLRDYKIKSYNKKSGEIIVTKDDVDYRVSYFHPAEGY